MPLLLTIVIPVRKGGNAETTLRSLRAQTFQNFDVLVIKDQWGNANRARNAGFAMVRAEFVLFSDDDIRWESDALDTMMRTLREHPEAAWVYGSYAIDGRVECDGPFDIERLRRQNFISTMSIIRTASFPGFDNNLHRLQDWDLWLTMTALGHRGVSCGRLIFTTEVRAGITYGGQCDYQEAERIVRAKHRLP